MQKLRAYRALKAGGRDRLKSCSGLSVRKRHLVQFCLVYFSFAIVMTLTEQSLRHFIVLVPCTCEQNVAFVALPFSNGTITVGGSNKNLKHLKFKFLPLLQWLLHFNLISLGYINNMFPMHVLTFKITQNLSLSWMNAMANCVKHFRTLVRAFASCRGPWHVFNQRCI